MLRVPADVLHLDQRGGLRPVLPIAWLLLWHASELFEVQSRLLLDSQSLLAGGLGLLLGLLSRNDIVVLEHGPELRFPLL